ncbi:MAG: ABC transporter ATP-binding protein [Lachnospiraceae bacterium]|nr:ABC transporter ATP-binding protein [Lachnospiraceae bacterium]
MPMLETVNLQKIYKAKIGSASVEALNNINFSVEAGEFVAIMGESGSGKTTLLNLLAALDTPTAGEIYLEGKSFSNIKEKERAAFRRNNLGFVFQDFNLLDTFTLEDNILLPLVLSGTPYKVMQQKLHPLTTALGIDSLLKKYPYEVSGGQKQRTAVARALITSPKLLLADEPTGALDSKASMKLLNQFEQISKEGQTIVMVTHSVQAACHASRVLFVKDGIIFHQLYKGHANKEEMFSTINDALTSMLSGGADYE